MIGEEGKLGFIYDDTEAVKFYSGQSQKYMWHFWGEAEQLQGYPLQVIGTKKETGEQITVFKASALGGAINGADAHHPSVMALPSAGLWRLDAYIGEKFYGSVVVEIHEAH
ncbi:hypothetical protein ACFSL6_02130 [Paenibacillus thailandensis]|uniref:DUF4871 domain-containing protein n=1 Tax=Paenibacillus thailandensis TaxID=393250 RepID=A0ABW5QVD9_9BACL